MGRPRLDLAGKTFGKLTVIGIAGLRGKHSLSECLCECGNRTIVLNSLLKRGATKSCGCLTRVEDLTGRVFGRLAVIEMISTPGRNTECLCRCECGKVSTKTATRVKSGEVRSCGCMAAESLDAGRLPTHGMRGERVYSVWSSMKARCQNIGDQAYYRYGGRGIKVCERWQAFEPFSEDMGSPPEGYSIDRIDNDGDYCPENCRWASDLQQARNTRVNRNISANGVTRCLSEWAEVTGINRKTIARRLDHGWSPLRALTLEQV